MSEATRKPGPGRRPLRILMLSTFYPPFSFGGDAVGVQRMAQALARRGHQVSVVHDEDAYLTLGGKEPQSPAPADGVRRIGLRARHSMLSNLLTQQTGYPLVHGREIRRIVEQGHFDIVWNNNASLITGPGMLAPGDGLHVYEAHEHWLVCPTHVLWRHDRELCDARQCLRCALSYRRPPQIWRATGLLERNLDKVDLLIAKSAFSRDKHREFGLKHDMEVLPYFLPAASADSAAGHGDSGDTDGAPAAPHDRPYFLFVGRLEKIKGLQDVIPVFDSYGDADLLILGDGDYADTLKRQAAGNRRIRFLWRKSLDELTAYYRGALGLIVPSVCYETFGIILIESFRLGTPVIARRLGPFPEIVEAAGGGALFGNREELLAAMRALQRSPELRARQSQAARDAFARLWQEEAVLERYGAAFARAARRKGADALARMLEAGLFENGA